MGYSHFHIGCVFAEYGLFNTTTFIRNLIYMFWYNFDAVLYQFLETGTSDRCLMCIVQRLRFSGFILYPISCFLYSPFKQTLVLTSNVVQKIVFCNVKEVLNIDEIRITAETSLYSE